MLELLVTILFTSSVESSVPFLFLGVHAVETVNREQ